MKKLMSLSLILVIMMTLVTNVYAASSYKLALKPNKREISKGDEVTVSVNLSGIQDEKGLIALGATLEFDEESLELVKMNEKGEWSKPTYNEVNGKLVTDRNGYATENETAFTMTFKVKEESKESLKIVLSNITASNGNEDIKIEDINTTISVKDGTGNILPPDEDNNNTNDPFISEEPTGTNQIKDGDITSNNTTTEKDMPDTGSSNLIITLVTIAGVATIVSFVRMKKANEQV